MREKIILGIALFCILIYAAAIGFGALEIHNNIQEQSALSKTEYAYLKSLSVFSAEALGFMSEAYKAEMSKALFATKTVQAFVISGSNMTFAEERRNGIIAEVNGDPRIKERVTLTQYHEALQIDGVRNPYINMAADIFDHTFFIITLKNTLLIVLGSLALVFLTLIAETLTVKQRKIAEVPNAVSAEQNGIIESVDFDAEDSIDIIDEEDSSDLDIQLADRESDKNSSDVDSDIQDEEIVSDTNPSENNQEPVGEIPQGPTGLYSPHGNISWEAYTKERLASELHRCASNEQDMVFIIMEFRGDKQSNDESFNTFSDMAVSFFGHRDMIFEWKEDGISIIVPNIDLDEGVTQCEDFHNRVKTKLLHSSSLERELCIGLSSRAGRLVDPDRLMFETAQAVERALVDPVSPIIAFKSDPEKYRAFVAGQHHS